MTQYKAKTFRNILYTGLSKGITLVCLLATSTVVARNLAPSDYGVVGFAGIIIAFLSRFSDMGVSSAAIRRPQLEANNLHSAFTLKILLSFGAFLVALMIAPFARHFFDHPATSNVIRVLALSFFISILGFVPQIELTREMNFRVLVIPGVVTAAVQALLAITLILMGWKYWAVILANVGSTFAGALTMHLLRRSSIRLRFDWEDMREFLRFGMPLLGTGVLVFLIFNLDNVLVGSAMGSTQLGYYALAFNWGSFICVLLADTVHSVLFPTFSAIQHDQAAMRRWYLKTVDLVGFLAVVLNTTLLANAPWFVVTFLGKGTAKWLPAVPALQILCVYGIVRAITEPLGNCIMARGRTEMMLRATLLAGTAELCLLMLALRSGKISIVAVAVLVAYASQAVVYFPFLRREFAIAAGDMGKVLWPIAPAAGAGWLAAFLLPASIGNTLVTLGARGASVAAAVALTHGILSRFRCFHEAGGLISQGFARIIAQTS